MDYRPLGTTGLKISPVGLGKFSLPNGPAISTDERTRAFAILDAAVERGVNYIDTANNYGHGGNEQLIGEWLKTKDSHIRDQLIIGTKVFARVGQGPNDGGLSRRHIKHQVERSLARLQCDYIDLYWTHAPDPDTAPDVTYRAMDDLVHQGKVRYIGCSNIEGWRMAKNLWVADVHHLNAPVAVQNPYNLIQWGDERNIFPLCQTERLAYFVYSPMEGGVLTGKYQFDQPPPAGSRINTLINMGIPKPLFWREEIFAGIARFLAQAKERAMTPAALSLAWVMTHPQVSVTLVAPRTLQQLDDVWAALATPLTPDERDALKANFPAPYTFD